MLVGVPLGIGGALHPARFESVLRPTLDAMQTVPSTVYLIPAVLFFGIGVVPAAIRDRDLRAAADRAAHDARDPSGAVGHLRGGGR